MDRTHAALAKKAHVFGLLEAICQELELTDTQYQIATQRYNAISDWLTSSSIRILQASKIYSQGSIRLRTSVKPIGREEFDVDLVCHLPGLSLNTYPTAVKKIIGDRLRENKLYRPPVLEEKKRCWRVNYANEFHLDITPSIPNSSCVYGGELVPDKGTLTWKATNPRGYATWFDQRASLAPRFHLVEALVKYRAEVEPLPAQATRKELLRRIVQLLKRNRDVYFINNQDLAPISIILTTLAAKAYERCVQGVYDSELDLMLDVVRLMPAFIEITRVMGVKQYKIPNDTTAGENFADKWNQDIRLPQAFSLWHENVAHRLQTLLDEPGFDVLNKSLSESFGDAITSRVFSRCTQRISDARQAGRLSIAPLVGLTTTAEPSIKVPTNSFFGGGESN